MGTTSTTLTLSSPWTRNNVEPSGTDTRPRLPLQFGKNRNSQTQRSCQSRSNPKGNVNHNLLPGSKFRDRKRFRRFELPKKDNETYIKFLRQNIKNKPCPNRRKSYRSKQTCSLLSHKTGKGGTKRL